MSETATLTLTDFLLARIAERDLFWEVAGESGQAHPDRVRQYLAESEAMRRIVEEHTGQFGICGRCHEDDVGDCNTMEPPCPTLQFLGAIYADHPDYRDEWR